MKAVRMLGDKKVEVTDVPEPEPKDDLVVVKIMSSVICGTEHRAYFGSSPIPGNAGHEAAGVVWKTDKSSLVKEGDQVTIYPQVVMAENCHRCPACLSGEWLLCHNPPSPRRSGGTHCQYMLVPEHYCLPIPRELPFDVGAMIDDCIGTPYRALRRLGVKAGDTALVTGVGPIGAVPQP
jgi:threonine dehydrogenase-like Zn-dependent dehydrogenase